MRCLLFIDLDLPAEFRVLLPQQKKEQEMKEENLYKMAGSMGYPDVKTFYQVDPVAPYATTSVIQQQQQHNLMKQRVGSWGWVDPVELYATTSVIQQQHNLMKQRVGSWGGGGGGGGAVVGGSGPSGTIRHHQCYTTTT